MFGNRAFIILIKSLFHSFVIEMCCCCCLFLTVLFNSLSLSKCTPPEQAFNLIKITWKVIQNNYPKFFISSHDVWCSLRTTARWRRMLSFRHNSTPTHFNAYLRSHQHYANKKRITISGCWTRLLSLLASTENFRNSMSCIMGVLFRLYNQIYSSVINHYSSHIASPP